MVILQPEKPSPVLEIGVKAGGDSHYIRLEACKGILHLLQVAALIHIQILKALVHRPGIDDLNIRIAPEDAGCAVSVMQIYVYDQGPPGGRPDFLYGYGHAVEAAHAPGPVGRGMVAGRAQQSEGRLVRQGQLRRSNGSSSSQGGSLVEPHLFHQLNVLPAVHPGDVLRRGRPKIH